MRKCNACNRTFTEYDYEYGTSINGSYPINKQDLEYARVNVDLCAVCFERLVDMLKDSNMKDILVSTKEPKFVVDWEKRVEEEGIFYVDKEDILGRNEEYDDEE